MQTTPDRGDRRPRRASRRRLAATLGLVALAFVQLAASCGEARPRRPNVVLAVFDTTRFDDWSLFSDAPPGSLTPVLDGVGARGQRFVAARSLYTVTVPSHVSLFTGREVARGAARGEVDYEAASLFTLLGRAGYRTYAFSGNGNLGPDTVAAMRPIQVQETDLHERTPDGAVRELLELYGEPTGDPASLEEPARAARLRNERVMRGSAESVNAAALEALRAHARRGDGAPFLLFLNYNDAHDPYFPPRAWRERFVRAPEGRFRGNLLDPGQRRGRVLSQTGEPLTPLQLSAVAAGLSPQDLQRARELHRAELAYADHHFGLLLDELSALGLADDLVLVCASDHGEAFGEEGRMAHGGPPLEALVHVPLILSLPGVAPATIEAPVDLRDVAPTLLAYLGLPDEHSTGRDLLPLLEGRVASLPPPAPGAPAADAAGANRVPGQDAATDEALLDRLRALGYAR